MRYFAAVLILAVLSACSAPVFVSDAPPVPVTRAAPDRFELPARFALARLVYGRTMAAGAEEAALWVGLAEQFGELGSFSPLISAMPVRGYVGEKDMVEQARTQRYRYLLLVRMRPQTGSADIVLLHTGSGAVMATAHAISPDGGKRGFWGGQIRNPKRLNRETLKIAKAAEPVIEDMLHGVAVRGK